MKLNVVLEKERNDRKGESEMQLKSVSVDIDIKNIESINRMLHESLELAEQLKLKIIEINQSSIEATVNSFADKLESGVEKISII